MGAQYGPQNLWFLFNHIYDSESGIRIQSTSDLGMGTDIFIVGNVIHDISDSGSATPDNAQGGGAIVLRDLVNHYVVNNTLWNYQAGITTIASGAMRIRGNILGGRRSPLGRDVFIERPGTAANSILQNNLFDPSSVRIQWGDFTVHTSLSAFANATGKGQSCVQANPKFVDVGAKNFQLTAGSPAINTGLVDEVYDMFQARYGIDIRKDIQGIARPQGAACDLGAYEYSSQVALQPPLGPSLLKVR
jgi:hypothetical protein